MELELDKLNDLEVEDIGNLLKANSIQVEYELLESLTDRVAQTPIERDLALAMACAGLVAEPQVRLGRYRADFLVENSGQKWVVEADGRGFHDPVRDKIRDDELKSMGIADVIRFTGSEIFRDANSCAARVKAAIRDSVNHLPTINLDHDLDESQLDAVKSASRSVRVLAPAGSGKTKVLLNRVAELINRGANPSSILVLAFNTKAADSLTRGLLDKRIPVSKKLEMNEFDGVVCRTFNSFGNQYIRNIAKVIYETKSDRWYWEEQMETALNRSGVNLRSMQIARGSNPIAEFLKHHARVRAGLVAPDAITVELESYGAENNPMIPFGPIEVELGKLQIASQTQSFDDQIYLAVVDLLANPTRRNAMQHRFEHVVVDEFQDLNPAQLALIDILSRPHRSLFVVGDDDQLIYGWRFADTHNILGFHDRMPDSPLTKTYILNTNYRCAASIVDSSRRLIDHNSIREPKDIRAKIGAYEGFVGYAAHDDGFHRANDIAKYVAEHKATFGCNWRDIAVLCRNRVQQPLIAIALDNAGIPRTPLLSYRLFTHPAARLFRAYLILVSDPDTINGEDLAYLINRPERYVRTNPDVRAIEAAQNPWRYVRQLAFGDPNSWANRSLVSFVQTTELTKTRIDSGEISARDIVRLILTEFGLTNMWTNKADAPGEASDDADPEEIINVIKLFVQDSTDFADLTRRWEQAYQQEVNRTDMSDGDRLDREINESSDEVVISTIHASKGREYSAVSIFDYSPKLNGLTQLELEEERRVLYVGTTRAERSLLMSVDTVEGVHPYISETMKPGTETERSRISQNLLELELSEKRTTIELARHTMALEDIRSGSEIVRLGVRLENLIDILDKKRQETVDLKTLLDSSGFNKMWNKISGHQRRLNFQMNQTNADISTLESEQSEATDRVLLLQKDPKLAARQTEREVDDATSKKSETQQEVQRLDSRRNELTLLGF
jgi:DNA helicase-2/ATP-dependent DNA helicase PcrA